MPVVTDDPLGPAALPTPDSFAWFTETGATGRRRGATRSPCDRSRCSPSTSPASTSSGSARRRCSWWSAPDHLTVADEALAAYNRALEPKRLVLLPGGHFDAYVDDFELASGAAADWFATHLLT